MTDGSGWGRLAQVVLGSRPSALEMILGPERYWADLQRFMVAWIAATGTGTAIAFLTLGDAVTGSRTAAAVILVLTVGLFAPAARLAARARSRTAISVVSWLGEGLVVGTIAWVGPHVEVSVVAIPATACAAFVMIPRRAAAVATGGQLLSYAAIVSLAEGYERPFARVVAVLTLTVVTSGLLSYVVGRVEEMSVALADANRRLERYVAPQVVAGDLSPHRRRIAVLFVDLRGFTRFAGGAEPEDVVEVLGEYYAAVGAAAHAYGATVGSFAGDGVIAWVGDDPEVADPCGVAVDLALALRPALDDLRERWARHDFDLHYGIGMAYGYATLGTVGFEGRRDYTALGTVVNLAARLCGEAAPGEILLDARAHEALGDRSVAEQRAVALKGFGPSVPAFSLAAP